ncbi:MAG TPA: hypothetical protein VII56_18340 [Rhizomicrobium sp.]
MLAKARDFILRNARLLERRRFAFHFEGGGSADVVNALAAYRNRDGGFGAALEPDKRDPGSQPVDVQFAFETLDAVNAFDAALVTGAADWLASVTTAEGGVPFALASLNAYPHAPWWAVDANPPADLNPTAAIAGLLLKHKVEHPWVARASAFCWSALEKSDSTGFHTLMPALAFLEHAPERARAKKAMDAILERIATPGVVALDPDAGGYVQKPLDWAPFPHSPCRKLFSDSVIAQHLAALAAKQQEEGGWPISWDTVGPGVTLEWRGYRTLEALRTLKAYGALG